MGPPDFQSENSRVHLGRSSPKLGSGGISDFEVWNDNVVFLTP